MAKPIKVAQAPVAVEVASPVVVENITMAAEETTIEAVEASNVEASPEVEASADKPKNTINVRKPDGSIITLEKLEDYGEGASDEVSNIVKIAAQLAKQAPYVKQLYRDGKLVVTAKTTNLGDDDDPDYVTNFSIGKQDLADYLQAVADGKYKTRDKNNTAYVVKVLPGFEASFEALMRMNPGMVASVALRNPPKPADASPATEAPAFSPSADNIEAEAQRQARIEAEAPVA